MTATRSLTRAAVTACTAAALLAPAGVALAQDDPPPPSVAQLCAATDVPAVDALLAAAGSSDLAGQLKPLASLVVPADPDGLQLNAGVQLTDVRTALRCDDNAPDAPTSTPAPDEPFYPDCAAAIAAGVAPINRANGEPGYRPELDSDGDGVACEANEATAGGGTPAPAPAPTTGGGQPTTGGGFSQLDSVPSRAAETGGGPA